MDTETIIRKALAAGLSPHWLAGFFKLELAAVLALAACGPPAYVAYPRDETVCDAMCMKLERLGCPEANTACYYTCLLNERESYLRPMAHCVLEQDDVHVCGVRCRAK
jgi:hypothetical protein